MATTSCPVSCACHDNPYNPCSEPGGCGSVGCGREEKRGSCPACRRRDPEDEDGRVCGPCQRWLPVAVNSIPGLYALLGDELIPVELADHRMRPQVDADGQPVRDRKRRLVYGDQPRDPIAHLMPAGPASSVAADEMVSSSPEPTTPLDINVHDLLGPVVRDGGRPIDVTGDNWVPALDTQPRVVWADNGWKPPRRTVVLDRRPALNADGRKVMVPAGDQIGHIPVAQILDQEVRAWIDAGAPGSRWRPTPTVPTMTAWLARRLTWACDTYEPIGEFAHQIRSLRGTLMAALGEFDPDPEPCSGVACKRCDLRMLFRRKDGTNDVECQNPDCLKIYSQVEYLDWSTHIGAYERSQRTPQEVAELLARRD
jgi:hypothetical protein